MPMLKINSATGAAVESTETRPDNPVLVYKIRRGDPDLEVFTWHRHFQTMKFANQLPPGRFRALFLKPPDPPFKPI